MEKVVGGASGPFNLGTLGLYSEEETHSQKTLIWEAWVKGGRYNNRQLIAQA